MQLSPDQIQFLTEADFASEGYRTGGLAAVVVVIVTGALLACLVAALSLALWWVIK